MHFTGSLPAARWQVSFSHDYIVRTTPADILVLKLLVCFPRSASSVEIRVHRHTALFFFFLLAWLSAVCYIYTAFACAFAHFFSDRSGQSAWPPRIVVLVAVLSF